MLLFMSAGYAGGGAEYAGGAGNSAMLGLNFMILLALVILSMAKTK